ncbi:MAG: hypothetical protein KIS78_17535 [Labilithrix sp.]|nr:hypothetical protein [Labilithrix sp.]
MHRDVSPANVLVGVDGAACITDFGLAKSLYAVERTTSGARSAVSWGTAPGTCWKPIDRASRLRDGRRRVGGARAKRLFRGENDGDTLGVLTSAAHAGRPRAPGSARGRRRARRGARARLREGSAARTGSVAELARDLGRSRARGLLATHAEDRGVVRPYARGGARGAARANRRPRSRPAQAGARNHPGDATPLPAAASGGADARRRDAELAERAPAAPDGGTRAARRPTESRRDGDRRAAAARSARAGSPSLVAIAAIAAGVLRARASARIDGSPSAPART